MRYGSHNEMSDVAQKRDTSNIGMGCLGRRMQRYTNVVGYWKEIWRTDKADNVAHGEKYHVESEVRK